MYGLLLLLGIGACKVVGSMVDATRDAEMKTWTNNGTTYQKYSQPGLFDSRTNRQCYPSHVKKYSNGRYVYDVDMYYQGDIKVGDYVLRDNLTGKIIKNVSAEERAAKRF